MFESANDRPLKESELDRLKALLSQCGGDNAMSLEELDGFFSALIVGPEMVSPSEYLPEVFGTGTSEPLPFDDISLANEFLGLTMRLWNSIIAELYSGDFHVPLLFEDEQGTPQGNEWALGFMRGVTIRPGTWDEIFGSEETEAYLFPMLWFVHEHDPDPSLRPPPIRREKREELLACMSAGLAKAYEYFRPHRERNAQARASDPFVAPVKIGRNQPCPCGSGKKYKHCHGKVTVQ